MATRNGVIQINTIHLQDLVREMLEERVEPLIKAVNNLIADTYKLMFDVADLKRTCQNLMSIEANMKRRNLVIHGLRKSNDTHEAVKKCLIGKMKLDPGRFNIAGTKRIYELNGTMSVRVEFSNDESVKNVLANVRHLDRSQISIERDLDTVRRNKRKAMIHLKRNLAQKDATIPMEIKNDQLRVGRDWFYWDNNYNFTCNSGDGKTKLNSIFSNTLDVSLLNYTHMFNRLAI